MPKKPIKPRRRTQGLNERERAFARYIVAGANPTEAARKAGYSPKAANRTGSRLMKRPEIKAEIERVRTGGERADGGKGSRARKNREETVDKLLTSALDAAASSPRATDAADLELRRVLDEEVQARIASAYFDAALIDTIEYALARKPATITRFEAKKRGAPPTLVNVAIYRLDLGAANKAIEIGLRRAAELETSRAGGATELVSETQLSPELRKALEAFRRVVKGEDPEE